MKSLCVLSLILATALPAGAETMDEAAAQINALSHSAGPGKPLDPPLQGKTYSETDLWLDGCHLIFEHRLWVTEGSFPLIHAETDLAQISSIAAEKGMNGVRLDSANQTAIKVALTLAKPAPTHGEYLAQPIGAMDHKERDGPFLMIVLFDADGTAVAQARDLAAALIRYRDTWCALTG